MTSSLAFPCVPGLLRPGMATPGTPAAAAAPAPAAGPLPAAPAAPAFMTTIT